MTSRNGLWVVALLLAGCGGKDAEGPSEEAGGADAGVKSPRGEGGDDSSNETPGSGGKASGSAGDSSSAGDSAKPSAQGAMRFSVGPVSPLPAGKACPAGAAFTSELPVATAPTDALDATTYRAHVVDGEDGASVSCRVAATGSGFEFAGRVALGGKAFDISAGTSSGANGTANVLVADPSRLPTPLASPGATCTVQVGGEGVLQIKPGSMWGAFSCPSVESPPSDYCKASGFFVLENCAQE